MKTNTYAKNHYRVAKATLKTPVLNLVMANMCKNNQLMRVNSKRNQYVKSELLAYLSKC